MAVTVRLPAVPAVTGEAKPATMSVVAAAAFTVMPLWVPVMLAGPVSAALSDCVPAVFKVALNEPAPFVSVESPGRTA